MEFADPLPFATLNEYVAPVAPPFIKVGLTVTVAVCAAKACPGTKKPPAESITASDNDSERSTGIFRGARRRAVFCGLAEPLPRAKLKKVFNIYFLTKKPGRKIVNRAYVSYENGAETQTQK